MDLFERAFLHEGLRTGTSEILLKCVFWDLGSFNDSQIWKHLKFQVRESHTLDIRRQLHLYLLKRQRCSVLNTRIVKWKLNPVKLAIPLWTLLHKSTFNELKVG